MIYFIQSGDDGPIKIGHTADIGRRLAKMQSDSPDGLSLIGTIDAGRDTETTLHLKFARLLYRGEWYSPDSELLQYISDHATFSTGGGKSNLRARGIPLVLNRIPMLTRDQIDALCAKFKMTPGELVTLAVDRLYQKEQARSMVDQSVAATTGHEAHSADGGKETE